MFLWSLAPWILGPGPGPNWPCAKSCTVCKFVLLLPSSLLKLHLALLMSTAQFVLIHSLKEGKWKDEHQKCTNVFLFAYLGVCIVSFGIIRNTWLLLLLHCTADDCLYGLISRSSVNITCSSLLIGSPSFLQPTLWMWMHKHCGNWNKRDGDVQICNSTWAPTSLCAIISIMLLLYSRSEGWSIRPKKKKFACL